MKIIVGILGVWLCLITYYTVFDNHSSKKTVFIDNYKVFDQFEFKKEQDTLLYAIEEEVSVELDSITKVLNSIRSQITVENQSEELLLEYNALQKEYSVARQKAENIIKAESTRLTNDVYKKLNEYIEEYGRVNKLDIVLGSDGSGTIMYIDSLMDVTDKVTKFINDKYLSN